MILLTQTNGSPVLLNPSILARVFEPVTSCDPDHNATVVTTDGEVYEVREYVAAIAGMLP